MAFHRAGCHGEQLDQTSGLFWSQSRATSAPAVTPPRSSCAARPATLLGGEGVSDSIILSLNTCNRAGHRTDLVAPLLIGDHGGDDPGGECAMVRVSRTVGRAKWRVQSAARRRSTTAAPAKTSQHAKAQPHLRQSVPEAGSRNAVASDLRRSARSLAQRATKLRRSFVPRRPSSSRHRRHRAPCSRSPD